MTINLRMASLVLMTLPFSLHASELDTATAIEAQTTKSAAASQQRIDTSAITSLQLKADIAQRQQEIENLTLYRNHLQALVADQNKEVGSLNQQITDIKETRKGVVPLMYRMIDDLQTWIEQDLPIKSETRTARVETLKAMMGRADVADAEKFRQILEAYLVELAYGGKMGLYQETLNIAGQQRDVDVLHLGRLSLVARSLNGETFWYFDAPSSSWTAVDASQNEDLAFAFKVANQSVAPTLLTLPLSVSPSHAEAQQ
ncbi:DUF3450 domain-containing protein [Enterovibrio norvegicus]|uniref:DUF3450 domain-containing protein n=1 Tax=Enterovibrio norvegicus TaxID=188144 RepID=UPI000C8284E9|nr:DUF3450 domain-containing protein [Enterovibrio norvegicus]PML82182.1 hypothetical protein BCT69_00380 [Enterovibrio norvegicus]